MFGSNVARNAISRPLATSADRFLVEIAASLMAGYRMPALTRKRVADRVRLACFAVRN
jgi:hypothetical protein